MGKTAIIVIGLICAWSWMTHQPVAGGTYRDPSTSIPERDNPSRSSPSRQTDDNLENLRDLGGALWEQLLRPTLVTAASYALDALSRLLASAADELPSAHAGHGALASRPAHADR